jgi:glutamyl-tRNA synthetase
MAWRLNKAYLMRVLPLVRERIKRFDELVPAIEYFFAGDLDYTPILGELAVPDVAPIDVSKQLLAFVEQLEAREGFDAAMLEDAARKWVESTGWKSKHAFMLLRLVITGRKASPPLFETMAVLGKEMSRRRLRCAADVIAKSAPKAAAAPKPAANPLAPQPSGGKAT